MTTFTLTLPDELAERLAALPADAVNTFAVSALSQLVGDADDDALLLTKRTGRRNYRRYRGRTGRHRGR
jgi:hypothetical protein